MEQELTFGQKLVGLNINPNQDEHVRIYNERLAKVIDNSNDFRNQISTSPYQKKMISKAIDHLEIAQMLTVKAITWPYSD